MLTDEKLIEISRAVDEFLIQQVVKHEVPPINLSGVILARMIRLNQDAQTDTELFELFNSILTKDIVSNDNHPLH
jgi:hypothetical protein